jgi:hypothetical protein
LAALLAVAAAGSALAGLPPYAWFPPACLAAVWLLFAACRAGLPAAAGRLLHAPRFQAASLFLAGLALVGWQAADQAALEERDLRESDEHIASALTAPPLEELSGEHALTDAGRRVALWRVGAGYAGASAEQEVGYLRANGYDLKLIQTGRVDPGYNCHGWVFTGGKRWVRGKEVEGILRDNRYQRVSRPGAGDLAVFRDAAAVVTHSALVRGVNEDGTVLLESKWGTIGRYVHTEAAHAYAIHSCAYYSSPRGGHLLRSVGSGQ